MNNNISLVIMAAGLGSRFGEGIKQLEPVGPNGEIIMDYSIKDALAAGFNKIVFIIRKDIEDDFKRIIGKRIEKLVKVEYVFQELDDLPNGFSVPENRKKPWGTGHAVLACKDVLHEPFAVINADDYYGKEAFHKLYKFLSGEQNDRYDFCMAGFLLKNTLSENGGVTRGICQINDEGQITGIIETKNIVKTENGAGIKSADGGIEPVSPETYVSMNMWGLTPEFLDMLEAKFISFLSNMTDDACTGEYLLPTIINDLLQKNTVRVTLLETKDRWFGVTYKEDKESVVNSIKALIANGYY